MHAEPAAEHVSKGILVGNRCRKVCTSRREITRDCVRSYFVKGWAKNSRQVSVKASGWMHVQHLRKYMSATPVIRQTREVHTQGEATEQPYKKRMERTKKRGTLVPRRKYKQS
jgi:hypothetical protein